MIPVHYSAGQSCRTSAFHGKGKAVPPAWHLGLGAPSRSGIMRLTNSALAGPNVADTDEKKAPDRLQDLSAFLVLLSILTPHGAYKTHH